MGDSETTNTPTPAEWEAHQAFYRLTVNERDHERTRVDNLTTALRLLSEDMHNASMRPCDTCKQASQALGEPFGCILYHHRYSSNKETL